MQTASLSIIKKELQTLPQEELLELCVRIAKYKKENKELIHYMLFENRDEEHYVQQIKSEMEDLFSEISTRNFYIAKKGIRKILRLVNKYSRYSDHDATAIELLIFFCRKLNELGLDYKGSVALSNLYDAQIKKINKLIDSLHEDLQYDFRKEMANELNFKK